MRRVGFFAAAGLLAAAFVQPALAQCSLGNGIKHIVYIQFDNVHFRRDNPNVPSDLEQMPNLLKFLEGQRCVSDQSLDAADLAYLGRHLDFIDGCLWRQVRCPDR